MASEYGWTLSYIMKNVYPADFFLLSRQIKMRNIDEFLMQARIVSNPHLQDREAASEFIDDLLEQRAWYRGEYVPHKMDRSSLEKFKQQVRQDSRFGKVRQKGEPVIE